MSTDKNSAAFYTKLKGRLEETTTSWPTKYLYKFIVPSDNQKIAEIEQIFDNMGAVINTKASSKGTYTSVSIHVRMESPDAIIAKYKEVAVVDGVISL